MKAAETQNENLGNVRLAESLKTLLEERCRIENKTKSDVVRSALCSWLHAPLHVIISQLEFEQTENNGHGDNGS